MSRAEAAARFSGAGDGCAGELRVASCWRRGLGLHRQLRPQGDCWGAVGMKGTYLYDAQLSAGCPGCFFGGQWVLETLRPILFGK